MKATQLTPALVLALALPIADAAPHLDRASANHLIYKQLVELDTSQSNGDTFVTAQAMGKLLVDAGYPAADVHVLQSAPKKGNLVARLRGSGKQKPLMLVAHIDVVEAKREDWTTDPFKLVEKDGYFYGRGTGDDKYMASAWVANMIRWKQEGYKPDRDLILVLECDEENGAPGGLGMPWLIKNHKDLFGDAEYALNEGGGVGAKDTTPLWNSIQTSEKLFATYYLEVRNKGGHSSQPRKDNAIYQLANALTRLEKLEFPLELNDTTRGYFAKMGTIETGQLGADMKSLASAKPDPAAVARLTALPPYNAVMRTTCVATRLDAGHADNALPQLARATVNCRVLPGHSIEETQKTLAAAIADPAITITAKEPDVASKPSTIPKELLAAVTKLTAEHWPGIPVLPTMSAGAIDGRFLRNAGIPTFGHSGLVSDIFENRAHGKDERVSIAAYDDGVTYLYQLVKLLAGGK
jgi:acetylornithine deacetylase/succinyl-diaminopimelate desuccinylase-like protein